MTLLDGMNWIGRRKWLRPVGQLLHRAATNRGLSAIVRMAGRRMVSASAGAPAVLLTHSSMEKAVKDETLLYEAMHFTVEEMGFDTFCLLTDLSLEAEGCGCQVQFSERDLPMVVSHPLEGSGALRILKAPDPHRDGRMPVFLETMRRIKRNYTMVRIAVITGPFTLATHLRGAEIYLDTAVNPETAKLILEYCTRVCIASAEAWIEAGADMIVLAEPTGSQLSAAAYDEFSQVYSRGVIRAVPRPCILHVCGKAGHIVHRMCESGAAGISVDNVDMVSLVQFAPRDMVVIGNISPLTLLRGSPEEISRETTRLLDTARGRKEFTPAPGCDLAPGTPLENINAFVRTVKGYG